MYRARILFYKSILPILIFVNDKFVPKRFAGYNVGFVNFVKRKYINDIPLVCHEVFHSVQFWKNPIKYMLGRWLKYIPFLPKKIKDWSKQKTLEFETEAYAVQVLMNIRLNWIDNTNVSKLIQLFANFVKNNYIIPDDVNVNEIYNMIKNYMRMLETTDEFNYLLVMLFRKLL